ncbi:MAG: hypothetical protein VCC04_10825, partial [Myxococcota bacterium]
MASGVTSRTQRPRSGFRGWVVLTCATATGWLLAASSQACEVPEGPPTLALERCLLVEQGMRANLEGRYDEADATWRALRELDPTDPAPEIWSAETGLWRLILDPRASQHEASIDAAADRAIELADIRLERNAADGEALSHKGMALMIQARLNGMQGRYLSAGRAGEQGRPLLERSLVLDASQAQGQFPLGVYYYYAGIAPSFIKWVSWLWFVPKGDREKGLSLMRQVRDGQGIRSDEARFMLMIIDNYHAPSDLESALASGHLLHQRYPDNLLFHSELIEVLVKSGQYDEAIETALALEQRQPSDVEALGRPMLARILRAQATLLNGNSVEAWRILESMDERTTPLPVWGGAWLHLVRGQVLDARGERKAAVAEYHRVKNLKGLAYNERAALIAEAALDAPFVSAD